MPPSPVAGVAGAIRVQRLSLVGLVAAEAHGNRKDTRGKARAIYPEAAPITTTGLEITSLFEEHVEGAFRPSSSKICLHLIAQFPVDLVPADKDGRVSDDQARWMLEQAREFAKDVFGPSAVFADRIDRDECGQHVVDLFIAPKYEKKGRSGTKTAVSISRHLKELAFRTGRWVVPENLEELIRAVPPSKNAAKERAKLRSLRDHPTLRAQGQALQDAWFQFLEQSGQLTGVKRGSPKKTAGSDTVSAEELDLERRHEVLTEKELAVQRDRAELDRQREALQKEAEEVRQNDKKLKSYEAVLDAMMNGHLVVIGETEAEGRWGWRGPGSPPQEIRAGGKGAWKMAKALSQRVDQAIAAQVTAEKIASAVAAQVTKAAVNDKIAELARMQVTKAHIEAAANARITQAEINRAIEARVTEDSIKVAAKDRVTPDMIKEEARLQVTKALRADEARKLVTEADKRAQAREMTTPEDIAVAAKDLVTQKDIDRAVAEDIEPLKAQAKAAHEAAIAARQKAQQEEAKARAFRAGIEAWLAGDIVDAVEKDDGMKAMKYRDADARQRWSDQVRLAFELVWNFVRQVTAEIRKAIQNRVTPEVIREAANASVTEQDRIAAAAKSVTNEDRERAALGLLDQKLLLELAAAPLADRQRVAGEALAAAQQEAGMSPALQAYIRRKGGVTR